MPCSSRPEKRQMAADIFTHLPDIMSMGERIFEPHWSTTPHVSPVTEFLFVIEGTVRTVFANRSFKTETGGFILIPAGKRHRDEFDIEQGIKIFMVSFAWQHAAEYFKLLPLNVCQKLTPAIYRIVAKQTENLKSRLSGGSESDRLLAKAHLLTILLSILHSFWANRRPVRDPQKSTSRARRLMSQARTYLNEHYAEEISLEKIAGHLQISSFYLSHLFNQESGFSITEYLTKQRMQKAALLLKTKQYSVKEAAHAVGYNDSNYFSKVFRRHFGFPPRELK